jgi:hypothetical protein
VSNLRDIKTPFVVPAGHHECPTVALNVRPTRRTGESVTDAGTGGAISFNEPETFSCIRGCALSADPLSGRDQQGQCPGVRRLLFGGVMRYWSEYSTNGKGCQYPIPPSCNIFPIDGIAAICYSRSHYETIRLSRKVGIVP